MSNETNLEEQSGPSAEVNSPEHPKPKVSLANETISGHLPPHQHFRKTSINSEHSIDQHGPVRRKSILHNAAHHDHHANHHINYAYHSSEEGESKKKKKKFWELQKF